ncbi:MAG: NAD(P)/FAD-dependent oxidoreductase [Thermodesulfobacteriota bacterium]|nr:NAD(P)/FAD-dependent oxidoreductase [Thermodesulfobacteriota bacterium]
MYDVVIVGAGVSGLTNALLLARFGQRVAVVERAAQVAPLLRGFNRWGVHFDTGFHYAGGMADGEGLRRFFTFLGLERYLNIVSMRRDGFDRILSVNDSFQCDLPVGPTALINTLSAEFPVERHAIERFVTDILQVSDYLPYLNVNMPTVNMSAFDVAGDISLHTYLHRLTTNKKLRQVLSLHCILHGVAADQVPLRFHASVVGPYFRSASTIAGGGVALATAFEQCLSAAGVEFFCNEHVTKFHLSSQDEIAGVELADGRMLHCKTVVSTLHPQQLLHCLPSRVFRPIYRKRLSCLRETTSACLLFASCRQPFDLLHGRNLYLIDQQQHVNSPFNDNLLYITEAKGLGGANKNGFMVISPSSTQDFTCWNDSRCGQRPTAYYAKKRNLSAQILQRLHQEVPSLADQIDHFELATPLTLRDYMYSPDGALYGTQHQVDQYPLQAITRVKGLFISGQAVVAPGVMGAMSSAFYTSDTILGHERLIGELKQCN